MSENTLRDVLGKFVTGVTVVTAGGPSGPVGITANSFTSVSLDPALVLFCLHRSSRVRETFDTSRSFAVNILAGHQEALSRRFSSPVQRRTEGVEFTRGATGAPILAQALAYLDCELHRQIDAGDHVIVLGEVKAWHIQSTAAPLAFYGGRYRELDATGASYRPDHGLIAPIAVPAGDRVPDEVSGIATAAEYDSYFRLRRGQLDLAAWTRTCLSVSQELVYDLAGTSLTDEDKCDILFGLVTAQNLTLSRWLAAITESEDPSE
jgi:flavin reductase (DIM6/NTAB) family NADH-FMN oxidoreductase RutF